MRESETERLLADCVEEYHRRRAMGERVGPEAWEDRLGENYEEFRGIILTASSLDDLLNPAAGAEKYPRTWGQFTLLRILGRGSMGNVYEAMENKLRRVVALKVLRHGYDHDPVAVERFKREARACAQVQHDHVISILEFGVFEGLPYYAMPIVVGENLQKLIRSGQAPEGEALCRGLAGIADALSVLHERGIVHRDVKPGNIMVDESGRMVLADFGLARTAATETLTQTGQALGTPLYMSPEQVLGKRNEVDGRTDVYGLGVTLYEALAGKPPFRPDDYAALMRMIIVEQPPSLKIIAPEAPADLARIAMTAIEKEKDDRYASAAAMRDDLLAYAEGGVIAGRPVSSLRRRWRRSRKAILLAASVLLALCVAWHLIPPADGQLDITTLPKSTVTIDSEVLGGTRLVRPFPPGDYIVVLERKGCRTRREPLTITSGGLNRQELRMVVTDGDDQEILDEFGEVEGVEYLTADRQIMRSGGGAPLEILYPRGAVRIADLTEGAVELNSLDANRDGFIEIRNGERKLLRHEWSTEGFTQIVAIPAAVRAQIQPGDELTFGFYPRSGTETIVQVRVVTDSLADRFAKIDKKLEEQPDLLRRHMKAQLLFDAELYTAAYLAARDITRQSKGERSARGWYLQKKALERMGILSGRRSGELISGFNVCDPAKRKLVEPGGN